MGLKNITILELMLLSIMVGRTFAVIDTQEQVPTHENQQTLGNIGALIEPSSSAKILSESALPGKSSSRYIIRFARAPSSSIRFSRSPSSQIRFGRSQPFVRFGRSNELNNDYHARAISYYTDAGNGAGAAEKVIRFAKNGADEYYDDSIQVEPRSDSGYIRFGRSQPFVGTPHRSEALRTINWRNFLRLGRNTNTNIRFAGKRDGGSATNHHNSIPIETILDKIAQQKQQVHSANAADIPNERNVANDDDQIDANDANPDQYQSMYSNGNDLEQR